MKIMTLVMVTYGIGDLPLIKLPKVEYLDVNQPWYIDDAGALGSWMTIQGTAVTRTVLEAM